MTAKSLRQRSGEGVEFVDGPPASSAGGQDDLHVASGLFGKGDDGVVTTALAAGNGIAPGGSVIRDEDLVAARIISAACSTVKGDAAEALRFSHIDLEPQTRTLRLAGGPARGEVAIERVRRHIPVGVGG